MLICFVIAVSCLRNEIYSGGKCMTKFLPFWQPSLAASVFILRFKPRQDAEPVANLIGLKACLSLSGEQDSETAEMYFAVGYGKMSNKPIYHALKQTPKIRSHAGLPRALNPLTNYTSDSGSATTARFSNPWRTSPNRCGSVSVRSSATRSARSEGGVYVRPLSRRT